MKKLCTLVLAIAMIASFCMLPGMAEEEMQGNMYLTGTPIVKDPVVYDLVANIQGQDIDPANVSHTLALNEKTGVSFNWTVLTNAETSERVATIMASGDLPDVFINCLTSSDRLTYGLAGALLNINDYLQYAPNIQNMLDNEAGANAALVCPDGNIYSIPQVNMYSVWPGDGVYINTTVSINQKWLDALGLEVPTTTEEFENVLKAFRDNDMNGNGENDEIPMSYMYGQNNSGSWGFLFGPFGIVGEGTHLNVEDGKVFFAMQDERYVEAIKWIRELYAEGLIDPEVFTMDSDRYNAKVMEGNIGVYCDWQGTTYVDEDATNPTYTILDPLTGPSGACVYSNASAGFNSNYCMIASTAENPEILIRYFDYLYTEEETVQTLWGTFGEYAQDNGDGTYTRYTGSEYPNIWETSVRVMPGYFSEDMITRTTNLNQDTGVLSDKTGEVKYKAAKHYSDYAVKEFYPNPLLSSEANERISILETPIENAMQEKEIAWIVGQASIEDEYESFMTELESLGISEMVEIYQAAYDAVK